MSDSYKTAVSCCPIILGELVRDSVPEASATILGARCFGNFSSFELASNDLGVYGHDCETHINTFL